MRPERPVGPELLQAAAMALQQGALLRARKFCEQVLRGEPYNPQALHLLGLVYIERGMYPKGFSLLHRAAAAAPGSADILNNLAIELCRAGRIREGLAQFDRVVALDPAVPAVHLNRARALAELGRLDEAVAALDAALAVAPGNGAAQADRAHALRALGRAEEAVAAIDAALALGHPAAGLLIERGEILFGLGRKLEARASYDEALALAPNDSRALNGQGAVLRALDLSLDALSCLDRALAARPDFPEALDNRGCALLDLGRHREAADAFADLLARHPAHPYAAGQLLRASLFSADWSRHAELTAAIAAGVGRGAPVDVPFSFLAHCPDAALQRRCAEDYVARHHPGHAVRFARPAGKRIHLAYLSGDFRAHAMAFLMAGVFERHDRARFEVTAISLKPPEDSPVGRRLNAAFDHFIDAAAMTDAEVAALMREMGIDIAVDLMGHTAQSRPDILARRAAPFQVNYLGYPGTTGAEYIDAIVADDFLIPPGSEGFYTERVIRLNRCFQATDDRAPRGAAASRAGVGLPEAAFVFCAFNSIMKVDPSLFDIWMRLLSAVPASILWLFANEEPRANLLREAAKRGIPPERLVFAPSLDYPAHLARLACADLFLDTFPFNGGSTTSDALRMGLPVITCAGTAFASRMAGSLLTAVGLPDLVTTDLPAYEALAVKLAREPETLAAAKARLGQGRAGLFDTAAFVRDFEAALVA